jgi:hypothetical protein
MRHIRKAAAAAAAAAVVFVQEFAEAADMSNTDLRFNGDLKDDNRALNASISSTFSCEQKAGLSCSEVCDKNEGCGLVTFAIYVVLRYTNLFYVLKSIFLVVV